MLLLLKLGKYVISVRLSYQSLNTTIISKSNIFASNAVINETKQRKQLSNSLSQIIQFGLIQVNHTLLRSISQAKIHSQNKMRKRVSNSTFLVLLVRIQDAQADTSAFHADQDHFREMDISNSVQNATINLSLKKMLKFYNKFNYILQMLLFILQNMLS